MAKTPYPWAQSDSQPKLVYADSQGVIDFQRPVAKFEHADDARAACLAGDVIAAQTATLRAVLPILEQEAKQRQASGLPGYIEPVKSAVERVKAAIAEAEGWTR